MSLARKQQDGPNDDNKKGKCFWSWDNPAAIVSGVCIGLTAVIIIAGIVYWERLAAWWDGPADAEGNGDTDEDDE